MVVVRGAVDVWRVDVKAVAPAVSVAVRWIVVGVTVPVEGGTCFLHTYMKLYITYIHTVHS